MSYEVASQSNNDSLYLHKNIELKIEIIKIR